MVDEVIAHLGLDSAMSRTPNMVCERAREELGMQSAGRIGAPDDFPALLEHTVRKNLTERLWRGHPRMWAGLNWVQDSTITSVRSWKG